MHKINVNDDFYSAIKKWIFSEQLFSQLSVRSFYDIIKTSKSCVKKKIKRIGEKKPENHSAGLLVKQNRKPKCAQFMFTDNLLNEAKDLSSNNLQNNHTDIEDNYQRSFTHPSNRNCRFRFVC